MGTGAWCRKRIAVCKLESGAENKSAVEKRDSVVGTEVLWGNRKARRTDNHKGCSYIVAAG